MSETHSTEMSSSRSENFNHHFLTKKKMLKAIHFLLLKWNLLIIWINFRMVFMTKYHEVIVYFVHMVWINLEKKFKKVFWVSKIIFYTGLSHSSGTSHLCCLLPFLPRFLPTVQWAVQRRSSQSSLQLDCRLTYSL